MDQGFWIFLMMQLAVLGVLSKPFDMVGRRRMLLSAGVILSLMAACSSFLVAHATIRDADFRKVLGWIQALAACGAVITTALSVMLPEHAPKKA